MIASLIRMAQRIIDDLSRPFDIDGNICRFGASIGIARETLDSLDCETLMSRADIARNPRVRRDRARWIEAGHFVPKISVNVSARRLRSAGLVEMVRALDLPHGVITFERRLADVGQRRRAITFEARAGAQP